MRAALARIPADTDLGLVGYKYQFLLYLDRPIVDFGHRRWLDPLSEERDAARWLDTAPRRVLIVPRSELEPCFDRASRELLGSSAGEQWLLVRAPASAGCAERGDPRRALHYAPP